MTDRERVESLELHKAMKFFSMLSENPFVAMISVENSYHLFTKGTDEEVEELMRALRING